MKFSDLFSKASKRGEKEKSNVRYEGQIKAPSQESKRSESDSHSKRKKIRKQYEYKGNLIVEQPDNQPEVKEKNKRTPINIER